MLLGIVLHAALAFTPDVWVVQDKERHDLFGLLVEAIHGFRMPVFFLMSGFFTAMLWLIHVNYSCRLCANYFCRSDSLST